MIEIRRVGPDGWKHLRAARLAALQDAPHAFASTYQDSLGIDEDEWRRRAVEWAVFLAFDGPDPVGVSIGFRNEQTPPGLRHLISMWVSPAARGRGVAGRLIGAVADWARAEGARELSLWVVIGNDSARAAYERAGFVATGEQQPLPGAADQRREQRMVLAL